VEQAGFPRPRGTIVWWAEKTPAFKSQPGPRGFQVERRVFDRLLLNHAAANGVRVLCPAHALKPVRLREGGWSISVEKHLGTREVICKFVVDACGGRSNLGVLRTRLSPPLFALFAILESKGNDVAEGRVEAGENEWCWHAPMGRGRSLAAAFLNPRQLLPVSREPRSTHSIADSF
jgi:2-polyprenyl-6-methoxyphenol hydroxylase-like FAD-dependent oxidoreductase